MYLMYSSSKLHQTLKHYNSLKSHWSCAIQKSWHHILPKFYFKFIVLANLFFYFLCLNSTNSNHRMLFHFQSKICIFRSLQKRYLILFAWEASHPLVTIYFAVNQNIQLTVESYSNHQSLRERKLHYLDNILKSKIFTELILL